VAAVYKKGRTSQVQSLFLYFSINAPSLKDGGDVFSLSCATSPAKTMQINRHGVTGISLICGAKFRGIQTFGNVFNSRNPEQARAGTC
jgi:hypothetical protein